MAKPIVAIVGRPNVGKSTLFNKLAGHRIAIVDDTPGVTRDRIYADADWLHYEFKLIDTGGIEPKSDDIILAQMKRQAQIAIDTADVIIFLVDGKQGLTDSDNEVATMLRISQKPIVLAVNKVDNLKDEASAYEFYNLGIGNPIAISAGQALGLGDLLDEVVAHFKDYENEEEDEFIRVAFVGRPNVGKSSLINKLLGEERSIVTDIAGTTRDAVDSFLDREEGKFVLVDTAGLRRKSKVKAEIERYSVVRTLTAIERADVVVLMIDAEEGIADQDEKIIGYAHDMKKAIMVIVNKWDLIEKDDKTMEKYMNEYKMSLKFMQYAPFLFISALTGQRTHKVLSMIRGCYDNYNKKIGTGVLNDVIGKALLQKEPPMIGTKRLKVFYGTQTGVKPPTFVFFINDQSALHFSYSRYIENQLRDAFDFTGTGIKIEYREKKKD
ncbi:MAG TPA: ribosome biogenesis GTPase Der [Clostridiaceae bacterium]|nr:ribosome biogenesis GTPase Der [Clostridiaceae bacterium]